MFVDSVGDISCQCQCPLYCGGWYLNLCMPSSDLRAMNQSVRVVVFSLAVGSQSSATTNVDQPRSRLSA